MDLLGMDPNKLRPATMFTSVPLEALEQIKLDAQRYEKLKAEMLRNPLHLGSVKRKGDFVFLEGQFDAAVDTLEDVTK